MLKTSQYVRRPAAIDLGNYLAIGISALSIMVTSSATASVWIGGSGDWSSNSDPGWNGTGVPNAIGAVASFDNGAGIGSMNINNDTNPTIGTIELFGDTNRTLAINNGTFTLNQDGTGTGVATIRNSSSTTNSHLRLNTSVTFVLADDLRIENTSDYTGTSAIRMTSKIEGNGNLTFNNIFNSLSDSRIELNQNSTFTGNVLIERGAVVFGNSNALGNAANAITLGSAGNGSASLVSINSNNNLQGDITVTAGTGGTLLLGSIHTGTSNSAFNGSITLNDDLSITSVKAPAGTVNFTDAITGIGGITKIGNGSATFTATNTYTGDTTISDGSLILTQTSETRFLIQNNDVSNTIDGTGTVTFNGLFRLDATSLTDNAGTWNLVDVSDLSEIFGSTFSLAFIGGPTFTDIGGGVYTSGGWTFSTTTGNLTLIPEPGSLGLFILCGTLLFYRRRNQATD